MAKQTRTPPRDPGDENFAARLQEARRVLATGDEAGVVAYLTGASSELVDALLAERVLRERGTT